MNSKQTRSCTLMLFIALSATSCGDFTRGDFLIEREEEPTTPPPTDLSYETDIHPLVISSCGSCHSASGQASGTTYILDDDVATDYATVLGLIDTDTPVSSRMLVKARGQGHGGGAVWPSSGDDYNLVLAWIELGAEP